MSKRFAKEERCAWVVADWLWEEPDFSNIPKDFYTIEPVFTEYCIVVVVSVLQAITEEQTLDLTSVGISAAALGESDEMNKKNLDQIHGQAQQLWFLGVRSCGGRRICWPR